MRHHFGLAPIIVSFLLLSAQLTIAYGAPLGTMRADKVLFLGNSITCCPPKYRGLSASTQEKDFVHLLAKSIEATTGGMLQLDTISAANKNADGSHSAGNANIVNIADIFERCYATYPSSNRLQNQIAWKPDIVVLQFGENVPPKTFDAVAFKNSLRTLLNDLKAGSNPEIFLTGHIIGSNGPIDSIKQEICKEDPSHRTFVDLSAVFRNPENIGEYNHPSDKGMAAIANAVFRCMVAHAAPKISSEVLPTDSLIAVTNAGWTKKRLCWFGCNRKIDFNRFSFISNISIWRE